MSTRFNIDDVVFASTHKSVIRCVSAVNNELISLAYCDKTIRTWDLTTGKCVHSCEILTSSVYAIFIDNVITSCTDNSLKVWHTYTGKCIYINWSY